MVEFLLWKKQHSSFCVLGDYYLNNIKTYHQKKANKHNCHKKAVINETKTSFLI